MIEAPALDIFSAASFAAIVAAIALLARRWPWTAPAALAATAPFAWYHVLGPTEITVSKAALLGAAIGIAVGTATDPVRRTRTIDALRSNAGVWLLAALAALASASALWAHVPADAVRDALKWWWYVAAFAISAVSIERRSDAAKVALAMIAASVAVCAVGLWQSVTAPPSGFVANGAVIGRIAATLEGPNQFGAYLETVIPILAAVLWFGGVSWAALVAGALLLGALAADLLLAYSRGALWSCAVALAFLVVAAIVKRRADFKCPARRAAIVAALAALVVIPVGREAMTGIGWRHELWSAGWRDTSDSAQSRRVLWSCASAIFARHPIAGVGAGEFADAMPSCGPDAARLPRSNANNWYLETAADLGALGVAVLAAFLVVQFASVRSRAVWTDAVALGAYAALIAVAAHGLVDDVMPYPKAVLTFFVMLGTMRGGAQGLARTPA